MSPRTYPSARGRILDATERVLLRDGLLGLSVDAVLREARVSKGGFFHHFPSKDTLLAALCTRLSEDVGGRIAAAAARDPRAYGRFLRAQVELVFDMPPAERRRMQALVMALVAASLENPAMATLFRATNRKGLRQAAADGVPLGHALLVQLALDGYWLAESVGALALDPKHKRAFRDALLALLEPPSPKGDSR
jgi:AcrR family transcriptional regulator